MEIINESDLSESEMIFKRLSENGYCIFLYHINETNTIHENPISFYLSNFSNDFELLYEQCVTDNFFWSFCPFIVYEKTIIEREQKFLKKFADANKLDFFQSELRLLNTNYKEIKPLGRITPSSPLYNKPLRKYFVFNSKSTNLFQIPLHLDSFNNDFIQKITYSQNRKEKFITSRINLLEKEIEESVKQNLEKTLDKSIVQVFKGRGYELFCYLNSEFTTEDTKPVAKYSYLYHFLKYHQCLCCTQLKYIEFIKTETNRKMSKILPENIKYDDEIKSILEKIRSNFDKSNRLE